MRNLPKVVFMGSDAICLPVLEYLNGSGRSECDLCAIVSQPDRRKGRGKQMQSNPVAAWAVANEIELLQPSKPGQELASWMQAEAIDVAFVMAYGHFLARALREAPRHGMVNFHGSLLPKYRGASPVETAIALGEQETGVALMQIVKEMDAGGVADVERVSISGAVTSPELRALVGEAVVPLLDRNLKKALAGELEFVPQNRAEATFCRKISKEDGAIDFELAAVDIFNRLRAFTPWPGGYFEHKETRIKVGRSECLDGANTKNLPVGSVVRADAEGLVVQTTRGRIVFYELQRPGGRMLPVADFLRGYPIFENELLKGAKAKALLLNDA